MPNTVHAKGIFNARLSIYICRSDNNQRGFVPDVVQVLEKYELSFELINYSHSGVFMSYPAWKRTCKQAILKFENAAWNARLHADDDFKRFVLDNYTRTYSLLFCGNVPLTVEVNITPP